METADGFSTGLSTSETERIALFIEECAEAQKVACKILRHGYESVNPDSAPIRVTNRKDFALEVGHVVAAIQLLEAGGDIVGADVTSWSRVKLHKLSKWLHFQPDPIMQWLRSCNTTNPLPRPAASRVIR